MGQTTRWRRSSLRGTPIRAMPVISPSLHGNVTKMLVDPWSVSPATIDGLAGQFFALSLMPYLTFLYFLNRSEVECPPLVNFGFRFLLVFVFATIPAGIYAKVHYHDILANIDWLHGGAESLLTITNLLIVLGFRQKQTTKLEKELKQSQQPTKLTAQLLPTLLVFLHLASSIYAPLHQEPQNALSFPTWVIHLSSLIEWLIAMGLVWQYAESSKNQKWKGLTWGMLPLHTSGICACTYHLFYNAPSLSVLVLLQAGLTVLGNTTMALATYRISRAGNGAGGASNEAKKSQIKESSLLGFEDLASLPDSNLLFTIKLFVLSAIGSALVKWGSLYFDSPFNAPLPLALGIIFVPTGLNILKWASRK
ncbi:hypothetical protein FGB62_40g221 [Gracilaria domingensis]|nr:hypothetical protein FGB62_40g221 [Gracilaria domingensis]